MSKKLENTLKIMHLWVQISTFLSWGHKAEIVPALLSENKTYVFLIKCPQTDSNPLLMLFFCVLQIVVPVSIFDGHKNGLGLIRFIINTLG